MQAVPDLERSLEIPMLFVHHLRYHDLPSPDFTGREHEDESMVREFDEAYDQLAAALSELYLVDSGGSHPVEGAPIHMDRYVDVCRQHTIVVDRLAWHPDVVEVLHQQLQQLPIGWIFAIDATDFPPGQALIVVEKDGRVHGWSDYSARSTLETFGFAGIGGPIRQLKFAVVSTIDRMRRRREMRKLMQRPFDYREHTVSAQDKE